MAEDAEMRSAETLAIYRMSRRGFEVQIEDADPRWWGVADGPRCVSGRRMFHLTPRGRTEAKRLADPQHTISTFRISADDPDLVKTATSLVVSGKEWEASKGGGNEEIGGPSGCIHAGLVWTTARSSGGVTRLPVDL